MSRKPALDGLRGLAVLAVMAFHTSPAAHGGFLGVDIFFVISGYLITSLLLREYSRTGGVDLRTFYLRRTLRLAPALLFMLLLTVPLTLTVLHQQMGMPVVVAVGSVLLYVANWANVAVAGGTGPLTHTWSLAIEEQFYLVWPLILIALLARRRRPPTTALALLIAVVILSRWIIWDHSHAKWLYYATTSHCDGLLIGSVLAILLDQHRASTPSASLVTTQPTVTTPPAATPAGQPSFQSLLNPTGTVFPPAAAPPTTAAAWIGLTGIVLLMATLHINSGATYEYGLPLIAACTALVIWHLATTDTGVLVQILSFRALTGIGVVSYGLYLYHFPVFKLVQNRGLSHPVQHALEVTVTIAITTFSWYVVEKPALRLKDRLTAPARPTVKPISDGPLPLPT
jgi:peptidoglycan/LPS O-acetylase OafA/YrhL